MSRNYIPFLLYLILAVIAVASLRADFRLAVLALLGGLAFKTWIGQRKERGADAGPEGHPEASPKNGDSPE